jgi:hypothetical protein
MNSMNQQISKAHPPMTKDQAEALAVALERMAAEVRAHKPAQCSVEASRRVIEMPPEDGWEVTEDGGLERVRIDIDW